jgi:hypothetical protein
LDTEDVSSLSLFLYSRSLTILAKNSREDIIAVHVYGFREIQELFEIIATDSFIQSSNTSARLYVHNNQFCLIPSHLFDPSHKEQYLNFSTEVIPEKMEIFYEPVPSSEIHVIGGLSIDILKKFEDPLPELEIIPGAVFPLSILFNADTVFEDQEMFIFAIPGHIYIAAFSLGRLVFFNSFPVNGNEALLKYTLIVVQQLGFNQETVKVNLMGDLSQIHADKDVLSPYLPQVAVVIPPEKVSYCPENDPSDFKNSLQLEAYWSL